MVTCVAISLSGAIFGGRIAYTLTGATGRDRYAGYVAGVLAGLFVLGITGYTHFYLSSQSDPMIVSLCLAAIDCHLHRRHRWAFALAILAGLGRPEAWPFIGVYSIWAWRSIPQMRRMIVLGLLVLPLLWFGIPALTSKSWFSAGTLALKSPRRSAPEQDHGDDRPLHPPEFGARVGGRTAGGRARGVQARPNGPDPRARRGRLGAGRDRVRSARLARRPAVPVRAGRGSRGARRGGGRVGPARPAEAVWPSTRRGCPPWPGRW